MKVFTAWSIGSSTATGVLVMLVVGQLMGAPWVLAALNGLAIGAVALLVACGIRLGLFRRAPRDPAAMLRWRPQHGVGMVGSVILSAPASSQCFPSSWNSRVRLHCRCCSSPPDSPPTSLAASWRRWSISMMRFDRPKRLTTPSRSRRARIWRAAHADGPRAVARRDAQSRNVQGRPSETARIRFSGWGAKRGRNICLTSKAPILSTLRHVRFGSPSRRGCAAT